MQSGATWEHPRSGTEGPWATVPTTQVTQALTWQNVPAVQAPLQRSAAVGAALGLGATTVALGVGRAGGVAVEVGVGTAGAAVAGIAGTVVVGAGDVAVNPGVAPENIVAGPRHVAVASQPLSGTQPPVLTGTATVTRRAMARCKLGVLLKSDMVSKVGAGWREGRAHGHFLRP